MVWTVLNWLRVEKQADSLVHCDGSSRSVKYKCISRTAEELRFSQKKEYSSVELISLFISQSISWMDGRVDGWEDG